MAFKGDLMFLLKTDCAISRCGNPRSQQTSAQFKGFLRNVCWEDVYLTNMVTGVAVVAAVRRLEVI